MKAMPNPNHHPRPVFRVRTIALILSVTDPNVWPGAMTGGGTRAAPAIGACASCDVRESGICAIYSLVSSGFYSVMAARYVVRGLVFNSWSSAYSRCSALSADTRLFGSFRSPNTIASAGHTDWHAVFT